MMKSVHKPLVFFVFVVTFSSCNAPLDRASYQNWIQDYDNGLHVRQSFSNYVFDLQYQPHDYLRAIGQTKSVQGDSLQYYILKISVEDRDESIIDYNAIDVLEKQHRVYYYSFRFQNDIFLEEDGERLPCVLFHFENSDLIRHRMFLLGFENPRSGSSTESTLVVESERLSALPIKIRISKNNIPSLQI